VACHQLDHLDTPLAHGSCGKIVTFAINVNAGDAVAVKVGIEVEVEVEVKVEYGTSSC